MGFVQRMCWSRRNDLTTSSSVVVFAAALVVEEVVVVEDEEDVEEVDGAFDVFVVLFATLAFMFVFGAISAVGSSQPSNSTGSFASSTNMRAVLTRPDCNR